MKKITALALIALSTIATSSYSMFSPFLRASKVKRGHVIQQRRNIIHIKQRTTLDECGKEILYSPEQQVTDWFADTTKHDATDRMNNCIAVEESRLKKENEKKFELFTEACNQQIIADPKSARGMMARLNTEKSRLDQQYKKDFDLFMETWAAEIWAEGTELARLPDAANTFAWSIIEREAANFGIRYVGSSDDSQE
jgi:hypothetical protein